MNIQEHLNKRRNFADKNKKKNMSYSNININVMMVIMKGNTMILKN